MFLFLNKCHHVYLSLWNYWYHLPLLFWLVSGTWLSEFYMWESQSLFQVKSIEDKKKWLTKIPGFPFSSFDINGRFVFSIFCLCFRMKFYYDDYKCLNICSTWNKKRNMLEASISLFKSQCIKWYKYMYVTSGEYRHWELSPVVERLKRDTRP